MFVRTTPAAVWICAIALSASPGAAEPDGDVRLRVEWVDPAHHEAGAAPPEGRLLRLSVEPLVPLASGILDFSVPPGISIAAHPPEPKSFEEEYGAEGGRKIRMPLGASPARRVRVFDFSIVVTGDAGTITDFVVRGRRPDGTPIRGAIGVLLGERSEKGVLRNGAIEFPAASAAPAEARR